MAVTDRVLVQVSGESESVSHSHINGSTMATLRAHDAVALELTMSIVDLFNRGTFKLTEPVLFQVCTVVYLIQAVF